MIRAILFLALASLGPTAGSAQSAEAEVEATSLLGKPLRPPALTGPALATAERNLAAARRAWEHTPENPDSIIWYGRRTAYLGRFREAIAIYTRGISLHPQDARLYRHRGHRYLTTRRLDDAVRDFDRAYQLTKNSADQIEPDGQPNARGIPTSTLKSNIRYHLGLAHYLKGDFARALPFYREDVAASVNADMVVASSHWLYMTLRRLGRKDEAAKVLEPITETMDVIENGSYHRLLLLYKGLLSPDAVLTPADKGDAIQDATVAYGVGNWHLYNGREAEARKIFERIMTGPQWGAFGYLAAEAELARK